MAVFSARNCTVTYIPELAPTCIVKTRVELTEDYYIFSESDSTQAYEGFKGKHETDGGWFMTPIIHPLAYDLATKVYIAATNSTPHAYIKNVIDTYFKFCDYSATSIDDSFAAMDIPAFNNVSVSYVLRFFNILKKNWFYVEKTSLTVHWDDGTTASGKHFRYDTEIVKSPKKIPFDKIDLVTVTGGYDANGDIYSSTNHATTPGSVRILEKFPSIVDQTLLDAMSLSAREMWEQSQIFYTAVTAGNGLYQYGRTALFSTQKPLSVTEATYFIHSASYDLIERWGRLTMGVYMTLPPRQTDRVQENKQLVDNIEKNIHKTNLDGGVDFDETDLTDVATTWTDLDLSSITGTGVQEVDLLVVVKDNLVGQFLFFRAKGLSHGRCEIYTQVTNIKNAAHFPIFTDSAGKIEFYASQLPSVWTDIDITVRHKKDA